MKFPSRLISGVLIKRYKRFLADVQLDSNEVVTCHTANTGSMQGCAEPGSRVWLSDSGNEKRKYPLTWELVENGDQVMIGINTQLSNHLVKEAIEKGWVGELSGYEQIRSEVPYGSERSRIDLLLVSGGQQCYVEVKNVTYAMDGVAYFPDAVSQRGSKHLRELMEMVEQGARAVIFFCVQRTDVEEVRPADHVDPVYGETLRQAVEKGVEAIAYRAAITEEKIELRQRLPVTLKPAPEKIK